MRKTKLMMTAMAMMMAGTASAFEKYDETYYSPVNRGPFPVEMTAERKYDDSYDETYYKPVNRGPKE